MAHEHNVVPHGGQKKVWGVPVFPHLKSSLGTLYAGLLLLVLAVEPSEPGAVEAFGGELGTPAWDGGRILGVDTCV